jgi:chromate reductase
MPNSVRLLAFAGSMRSGSLNKKLLRAACNMAQKHGAQITVLELRELALPLYDGDLEQSQGLPAGALRLKQLMIAHQAFLIASPEYNSSISGVLKNAIDWASRPQPGEPPLAPFKDKVAGLVSASPGALGGLRGLVPLRSILENLGTIVVPNQAAIARANQAFDDAGYLKEPSQTALVASVVEQLLRVASRLNA